MRALLTLSQSQVSLLATAPVRATAAGEIVRVGVIAGEIALRATNGMGLTTEAEYMLSDTGAPGPWRWQAALRGYRHQFYAQDRDALLFHWHPSGLSHVLEPHIHVGEGRLAGLHIPSGAVGLADIVRFAIRELRTIPTRRDWDAELRATEPDVS